MVLEEETRGNQTNEMSEMNDDDQASPVHSDQDAPLEESPAISPVEGVASHSPRIFIRRCIILTLRRTGDGGSEGNETDISQSDHEEAMIRTPTPPEQSDIQAMVQSQVERGANSNPGTRTTSGHVCFDLI